METEQIVQYLPVLLLLIVAIGMIVGILIFSVVVGKLGKRSAIKDSAYECGVLPFENSGSRFSVKFYLVAMLFILFDVEVVFMYPWAVVYREFLKTNAPLILGSMISFIGILFIGYFYALKKGAFDWTHQQCKHK